jgi:hypothetical protein
MKTGKVGTNDAVQRMRRYSGMPSREYESAYGNTRGCYTAKHVVPTSVLPVTREQSSVQTHSKRKAILYPAVQAALQCTASAFRDAGSLYGEADRRRVIGQVGIRGIRHGPHSP